MPQQGVSKSVDEGIGSGVVSELFHTIVGAVEQRLCSPPVSGDFKGGTSVVLPTSLSIDVADDPEQVSSCVLTDDEGNVINDAHYLCDWSSADTDVATVDSVGTVTGVGAGDAINITATALGVSDTIAVTVTEA